MRNNFGLFICIFCLLNLKLSAQQIYSKDGGAVLPEKGDWGLGIDFTRMVNYAGLRLSQPSHLISGKYMADTSTVLRIGVRIGFENTEIRNRTIDRVAASGSVQAYPAPQQLRDNVWNRTSWLTGISIGSEKRRGSRLQGLYGYEVLVMLSRVQDKFRYGNELNASPLGRVAVDPAGDAMSSAEFGNAFNIDTVPLIQGVSGSARVLQRTSGLTVSVALRVFAGAEYFFLPKMSIGAELGWGLGYSGTGRSETILESEGASSVTGAGGPAIRQTTIDGSSSSRIGLGHDSYNPAAGVSASVRLHLYF